MHSFLPDFPVSALTLVQFIILRATLFKISPASLASTCISTRLPLHCVHRPAVTSLFSDLTELHLSALWRVKLCPPPRSIQAQVPGPLNVAVFENRVFADVIKLRSYWMRGGPDRVSDYCPQEKKFGLRHTEGKRPCDDTGRDSSNVSKPTKVKDLLAIT